jgi:hypothetical protein
MTGTMKSIGELLDQDKIWVSRNGTRLTETDLNEMDLDHIRSLRAWLLRMADAIVYGIQTELQHQLSIHGAGDQACLDLERELDLMAGDPEDWIRGTVLFTALTARLENVAIDKLTRTDLEAIRHLVKLALAAPPGTHTDNRLRDYDRLRRKLEGTGAEVDPPRRRQRR